MDGRGEQIGGDGEEPLDVARCLEEALPELRAFIRLRAGPLVRRHDQESDLVQSICREALSHRDGVQYGGQEGFRRWLFTVALRKLSGRRDHHTAARRAPIQRALGADDEQSLLRAYAEVATPSQHATVREELGRVEDAMARLDEGDRSLIVLSRIAGFPLTEIARELELAEGTVRMRLHRALAKLGVLLAKGEGSP